MSDTFTPKFPRDYTAAYTIWGVGVPRGAGGSKKLYYGHVAYQIDGYDEQNRMKVMFSP